MAKTLSVEEAVERARRAQDQRLNAVRDLARARQQVADTREKVAGELAEAQRRASEQIALAERADVSAYRAAVAAGWNDDELRKIGFDAPEKTTRTRRKTARSAPRAATPTAPTEASEVGTQDSAEETP